MTTSSEWLLAPGQQIRGKWKGTSYHVETPLGGGSNGQVYKVRQGRRLLALKLGYDAADHQSEVNTLQSLARASHRFRSLLVEVDDVELGGQTYPYSILQYMEGKPLQAFIRDQGRDWLPVIGLRLLQKLGELHACGFVFGDLKPENLIVGSTGVVELIDYGGATPKGRSVKQFTEQYDRGFWNAGLRQADEGYDLFAFAVLLLSLSDQASAFARLRGNLPQNRGVQELQTLLAASGVLSGVAPVLERALLGRYDSSRQALADWRDRRAYRQPAARGGRVKPNPWIPVCFTASLILFAAAVYWVYL